MNEVFIEEVKKRIEEQSETNPLLCMELTGGEVYKGVQNLLKEEGGRVHLESLLSSLGALAGFSCVYSLVLKLEGNEIAAEAPEVLVLKMKNGETAYGGDYINRKLLEDKISIWSFAAGSAQHVGCSEFLDINGVV